MGVLTMRVYISAPAFWKLPFYYHYLTRAPLKRRLWLCRSWNPRCQSRPQGVRQASQNSAVLCTNRATPMGASLQCHNRPYDLIVLNGPCWGALGFGAVGLDLGFKVLPAVRRFYCGAVEKQRFPPPS